MTTFSKSKRGKHAQPLLTFETTLPTRLLAPKSKRHHPPNLESQTPNMLLPQKSKRHCSPNLESHTPSMIAFSKIEEASFSESREPDTTDHFFKVL
ncbi:hypothetical protein ACFX2I_008182 [Malus domestica]